MNWMNDQNSYPKSTRFKLYVTYIDHAGTINDAGQVGILNDLSPDTGINLHVMGYRMDGIGGGISMNIVVPQTKLGEFKMPQKGDIIWVEQSPKFPDRPGIYMYSIYNGTSLDNIGSSPVPRWGARSGDYGYIHSYRKHIKKFNPTKNANFIEKFVSNISGYRFRSHYSPTQRAGKFVVEGDPVFDVPYTARNESGHVQEGGLDIAGGAALPERHEYPLPLNVPEKREEDANFRVVNELFDPVGVAPTGDAYERDTAVSPQQYSYRKANMKVKNYVSYQPILDKKHFDKFSVERELAAAEEYQVALRGNNKLLIQDQYGDGEQILITLKNQYDAGITIVQNADLGQVRIRDHLGQGVLMEANPDRPRVMTWTANRQVIEQGGFKDVGTYTIIRSGKPYGKHTTVGYGTDTEVEKDSLFSQEIVMVDDVAVAAEIKDQISAGTFAEIKGAGTFMVNTSDDAEQYAAVSSYVVDNKSIVEQIVANSGDKQSLKIELDGTELTRTSSTESGSSFVKDVETVEDGQSRKRIQVSDGTETMLLEMFAASGNLAFTASVPNAGLLQLSTSGLVLTPETGVNVTIGETGSDLTLKGTNVTIDGVNNEIKGLTNFSQ